MGNVSGKTCSVAFADLKLVGLSDFPASASKLAGTTGEDTTSGLNF
jgi:hypothetical protein